MYRIQSVSIKGFLKRYDFDFDVSRDITFLIGRNGSGKTVMIRIIRSLLDIDIEELSILPFSYCKIRFSNDEDRRVKPTIEVSKFDDAESLEINLYGSSVGDYSVAIPLVAGEMIRRRKVRKANPSSGPVFEAFIYGFDPEVASEISSMRDIVKSITPSAWLPLQRVFGFDETESRGEIFQPIDLKLKSLRVQMAGYLASLDAKYSIQLNKFQQDYLISIFAVDYDSLDFSYPSFSLEREQEQFIEIFRAFDIPLRDLTSKIERYFSDLRQDIKLASDSNELNINQAIRFNDANRAHRYIDRWQKLQRERDEIYGIKDDFVQIVSNLYINKNIRFNQRNGITIYNDWGDSIDLKDLSSGEKQMLILLSETVLQEEKGFLYIADEPELSLHLEWQSSLVDNIKALNPNVQMIFATHSPEVVGAYSRNVLNMEDFIAR